MKETLKRLLGQTPTAKAEVTEKEEVTMTTEVTVIEGAGLADALADAESLQAAVVSLTEQLAAANAQIAELTAVVDAAKAFQAEQERVAAEAKVTARVAALTAAVGTEAAAGLQIATASMDDAAFEAVVTALNGKQKVEADTPAFKEVGAEGATDQSKLAAEVAGGKTADYLRALVNNEIK